MKSYIDMKSRVNFHVCYQSHGTGTSIIQAYVKSAFSLSNYMEDCKVQVDCYQYKAIDPVVASSAYLQSKYRFRMVGMSHVERERVRDRQTDRDRDRQTDTYEQRQTDIEREREVNTPCTISVKCRRRKQPDNGHIYISPAYDFPTHWGTYRCLNTPGLECVVMFLSKHRVHIVRTIITHRTWVEPLERLGLVGLALPSLFHRSRQGRRIPILRDEESI